MRPPNLKGQLQVILSDHLLRLQGPGGEFPNVVSLRHLRVVTGYRESLFESKRGEVSRMAGCLYRRGSSKGNEGVEASIIQVGRK